MNFDLKALSLAAASKHRTDTLIVLISDQFQAGQDPLSALISKAMKAKDFSSKSGQMLQAYASPGITASKVIFLGISKGTPQDIKSGLNALIPSLKVAKRKHCALCQPTLATLSAYKACLFLWPTAPMCTAQPNLNPFRAVCVKSLWPCQVSQRRWKLHLKPR